MGHLLHDLRFAVRTLLKNPGFAAVTLCALALGIGANTAIFSLVNAVFLRPLPVKAPHELQYIFTGSERNPISVSSYPDFADFHARNSVFSDVLTYAQTPLRWTIGEQTETVSAAMVSGNFFDALGVQPSLGRAFLPEEDRTPMTHPVVILHDGLWRQRFGANPGIIGQTLTLNGLPFTVIGVAPEGFTGLDVTSDFQMYVPTMMQELVRPPRGGFAGGDAKLLDKRGQRFLTIVGRLKSGVTPEQAQSNISIVAKTIAATYPDTNGNTIATLRPASEGRPEVRQTLLPVATLLMAVVGAVLLIACANVANLMLARVAGRRREIAVRLSLGAGRMRLIRQLLTESLLISCMGGALGLLIATWSIQLLLSSGAIRTMIPFRLEGGLDARVLAFTLIVSLLTGIVFGLAPALRSFRQNVTSDLKNEVVAAKHGRLPGLRSILVVGQMAISIVLLIAAGLFLRSFFAAQTVDLGFDIAKLATMPMNINLLGYNRQQSTEFYRQAIERVEALPGVESASMARVLMLSGGERAYPYFPEGVQPGPNANRVIVSGNVVGLKFFQTIGVPVIRGRDFAETDREGAPLVVIVNEAQARLAWPGEQALGKTIRIGAGTPRTFEVIGVVRDSKYRSVQEDPRPFIYLPILQNFETGMTLIVRAGSTPDGLLASVRSVVQGIDKNLPLTDVRTMSQNVATSLLPARLGVILIGLFALLALLLASIGAYGVVSYTVAQRTKEIGIRMALGARQSDVMRLVVGQGFTLAVIGTAIGVLASVGLTRLVKTMLFGVSPTDPITFVLVGVVLIAVATLASYLPARRAARVDPMLAVRQD